MAGDWNNVIIIFFFLWNDENIYLYLLVNHMGIVDFRINKIN